MTVEPRKPPASSGSPAEPDSRADQLARLAGAKRPDVHFDEFVAELFHDVPEVDLRRCADADLVGAALSMFELAETRQPGKPLVRVFNPEHEIHGWSSQFTIIEIVNDDMPFLVDSVTSLLNRIGASTQLVIHPILAVERDGSGRLVSWRRARGDDFGIGATESFMQIWVRRQTAAKLANIRDAIERALAYVRVSVEDWPEMVARVDEVVAGLEENPPPLDAEKTREVVDFLRWLKDDHFTFLGAREYRFEGEGEHALAVVLPDRGLGLLRDPGFSVFEGMRNLGRLLPEVRHFVQGATLIRITKANTVSPVHRQTHLDSISIKRFDEEGGLIGENMIVGLFTSTAYTERVDNVPILRRKVARTIEAARFKRGSHNAKTLVHILETYPRDELFQLNQEEVDHVALGVLEVYVRQRVALFGRIDPFERFASCLVFVPREAYDTRLRERFQDILEKAFDGTLSTYYTQLSDQPLGRIHFIIKTTPGEVPKVDFDDLEDQLVRAAESWTSRLESSLNERYGEQAAAAELRRFQDAFPGAYRDAYDPHEAIEDIAAIHRLWECQEPTLRVRLEQADNQAALLKIFTEESLPSLSEVLPILERMGLKVLFERSFCVRPAENGQAVWVRELRVSPTRRVAVEDLAGKVLRDFEETFRAVWRGEVENDGFNRLVLFAGLKARQVSVFRAYSRYLMQARMPFSRGTVHAVLSRRARLAQLLWQLFEARFDPDLEGDRQEIAGGIGREILRRLDRIRSLEEDRVLRRLLNAITSTLRTNYYQRDAAGTAKPYLAFKLDSSALLRLPKPRPWREVWVYHPRSEGIHLRVGPVARGGIRWSDRSEDFRTEVLGLMKAQRVKNAVIVPEGSKGGFVVRRAPGVEEGDREQGVEAYRRLIRGLLDLTDNLMAGHVVPPVRTVRWDEDDTYLVVAADKGTATFSDYANAISREYGYWLGDAFASGGSAGYDHKRMGITAKGAWESVRRHFRELGKDIQREQFTVVGVGDMSGDVFGNGLLLSPKTQLIGAFNHQHIFLDPTPDPASSFEERKRLFERSRSSWADYDPAMISKGGGVFERSAKSIVLSPQVRELLGLEEAELQPSDLIRALLRTPVELLWLGGIGTYVKATGEADEAVGDRANDALRIEASELGAKVVGEGANLGLTQRGRIECALHGVRLNTDFIDNSAGVDCSDHEVNLKILLDRVVAAGAMTVDERDDRLRVMEEEVATLVLRTNYLQPQAISVTQHLGSRISERVARVIGNLERRKVLERWLESLPSADDLDERRRREQPLLVRPELAVLMSYVKLDLKRELLASEHLDDAVLDVVLTGYFPSAVRAEFDDEIADHPLRREIIATVLANEIVNRVGLAFAEEVSSRTGRSKADVALAYFAARDILGVQSVWGGIQDLDNQVPSFAQAAMLAECGRLVERCSVWILDHSPSPLSVAPLVASYGARFAQLSEHLAELISAPLAEQIETEATRLEEDGVPAELARRVAGMRPLSSAMDIVRIASIHGLAVECTARTYFDAGARLGFDWLRQSARALVPRGLWDRVAVRAAVDDLFAHQALITEKIIDWQTQHRIDSEEHCGAPAVGRWLESNREAVGKVDQLLVEMRSSAVDLAMLEVAHRTLGSLARGGPI